ncbi:hypothetical protein Glove_443g23 [Diversispora epigaea]|uniref:Uncharacterized protein n=1 Tax=Diversispora epigaea TaxID=1348612 RepID=A0A397GST1_9GLOM|nr:hypothetical protein Glove_443g23 [Diversispora epigaea]
MVLLLKEVSLKTETPEHEKTTPPTRQPWVEEEKVGIAHQEKKSNKINNYLAPGKTTTLEEEKVGIAHQEKPGIADFKSKTTKNEIRRRPTTDFEKQEEKEGQPRKDHAGVKQSKTDEQETNSIVTDLREKTHGFREEKTAEETDEQETNSIVTDLREKTHGFREEKTAEG